MADEGIVAQTPLRTNLDEPRRTTERVVSSDQRDVTSDENPTPCGRKR
jgi:hypothetical protein